MALTAGEILSRVSKTLLDEAGIYWPQDKLMQHLNDGQLEIVNVHPEIATRIKVVQLETGAKQTVPSDGIRIVEIIKNRVAP